MDGKKYKFARGADKKVVLASERDFIARESRARLAARIREQQAEKGRNISYTQAESAAQKMANKWDREGGK